MIKSYHGSMGISGFLFRKTWKPKAPWLPLEVCEGESESRREMKRLSAPNILTSDQLELLQMVVSPDLRDAFESCALDGAGESLNLRITLRGHSSLALLGKLNSHPFDVSNTRRGVRNIFRLYIM